MIVECCDKIKLNTQDNNNNKIFVLTAINEKKKQTNENFESFT